MKKASDSLNDLEEKLTEQLAGENKALFLRFCNAYTEFMGESELDTYEITSSYPLFGRCMY